MNIQLHRGFGPRLLATPVAIFMIFYALWPWLAWKLSMLISQFWWLVGYQRATGNGYLSFGCNQLHNHDHHQSTDLGSRAPPFALHRSLKGIAIWLLFCSCSGWVSRSIEYPSSSSSFSSATYPSGPWPIPSWSCGTTWLVTPHFDWAIVMDTAWKSDWCEYIFFEWVVGEYFFGLLNGLAEIKWKR